MPVDWKKHYNLKPLTDALAGITVKTESGEVAFTGFDFEDYLAVIESAVDLPEEIPETNKSTIIQIALSSAAKVGPLSPGSILQAIRREVKTYQQRPMQEFILATSLSIRHFDALQVDALSGRQLTFSASLPQHFEATAVHQRAKRVIRGAFPVNYGAVQVSTHARSTDKAVDDALDTVDLLRGIWNLFFHRRIHRFAQSDSWEPLNSIMLGPLHTLHFPDGSLATEKFWYEPDYIGPHASQDLQRDWEQVQEFERKMRESLSQSHYRSELEQALRRYTRTLDGRDPNSTFVKLWSLLEYLTNTGRENYDVTITRTSFLYADRDFHKEVLRHLRNYRNQTIHSGSESQQKKHFLIQLERYVRRLLEFLIFNTFEFANFAEAADFLSQPTDLALLHKKQRLIEKALAFRSPPKKDPPSERREWNNGEP